MTDQDTEQDLSPAEDVAEGVPSSDVDALDQEIETQDTDAKDDEPAQDEDVDETDDQLVDATPIVPIRTPAPDAH
jgi:hypothetical protein